MATSSTLKALKEKDDGPLPSDLPVVAPQRMGGLGDRLATLWRSVWRRRWLSVMTAWLICLLGWAAITLWPTSFMASAVIYADLPAMVSPDAVAEPKEQAPVALLKSLLLSEEGLTDLRSQVTLDPAKSKTLDQDIVLRSTAPPLFVVTYSHARPEIATQVLEALIQGFRSRRDQEATESQEAGDKLNEQIDDYKVLIQAANADLDAFRRRNVDYINDAGGKAAELAVLEEEVASLQGQISDITATRDEIAAELVKVRNGPAEAAPESSAEAIETQRKTLEEELAKLRERYADTHPYVTAVFDAIEALESKTESAPSPSDEKVVFDGVPIDREELEQRHGELIVEVATLKTRLQGKRSEIELLQTLTRTTSSVEAELARLVADKEALEAGLANVERRREGLKEKQRGKAEQEAFRLIRQPELPSDPAGPSRLMALGMVLLGGMGISAAVAVICNRLTGVFESAWQLKKRFDVGVLGTIVEVMTPAERRRLAYSRLGVGLAYLALLGVFSGLAVAEFNDRLTPLGDLLRSQILG